MYVCIYICACMHTHKNACKYACMHICMHTCMNELCIFKRNIFCNVIYGSLEILSFLYITTCYAT